MIVIRKNTALTCPPNRAPRKVYKTTNNLTNYPSYIIYNISHIKCVPKEVSSQFIPPRAYPIKPPNPAMTVNVLKPLA